MTHREQFLAWVQAQAKVAAVLWRGKGYFLFSLDSVPPLVPHGHATPAFDCSGLVTCGIQATGGPDLRATHNARLLAAETAQILPADALPGDLVFYGQGLRDDGTPNITHVAISLGADDGRVMSADGATSKQLDFETAAKDPRCRIKVHDVNWRGDYVATHRNKWLEEETNGTNAS